MVQIISLCLFKMNFFFIWLRILSAHLVLENVFHFSISILIIDNQQNTDDNQIWKPLFSHFL